MFMSQYGNNEHLYNLQKMEKNISKNFTIAININFKKQALSEF
jgi:hypothetical protein